MKRFEYTVKHDPTFPTILSLGDQGWELVTVVSTDDFGGTQWIFKREKL